MVDIINSIESMQETKAKQKDFKTCRAGKKQKKNDARNHVTKHRKTRKYYRYNPTKSPSLCLWHQKRIRITAIVIYRYLWWIPKPSTQGVSGRLGGKEGF